ncbi:OmpA family protein [Pontibacter sp. G13]|uniref:OmpA family protein n=1 Tax=Pontibacter sp. G13 TaxID=3074898 RepID=UPI00288C4690|nr:OmpA family protein [Pontibacter sp. G13]WNJ19796.1 OmpA family protein [Pontibacter sp. G13]
MTRLTLRILLCCLALSPACSFAQVDYWFNLYGGAGYDRGKKFEVLDNGTIILAGESSSQDDFSRGDSAGTQDIVIFKTNTQRTIIWKQVIGGSGTESLSDMIRLESGGFLLVGTTDSQDGDIPRGYGGTDVWAARISETGELLWSQSYGGSGDDRGYGAIPTTDGGFFLLGESASANGLATSQHFGGYDAWVLRINGKGRLIWEKQFGGTHNEKARKGFRISESEYLIFGTAASDDGNVEQALGKKDVWMLRMSEYGKIKTQRSFGGSENDDIYDAYRDSKGNVVIAGTSFSSDGDLLQHQGEGDGWLLKMDSSYQVLWSQSYGGPRGDGFNSVGPMQDGGYIMGGLTKSRTGEGQIEFNAGYYDAWMVKVDGTGKLLWNKTYGNKRKDEFFDIQEMAKGGFLAFGNIENNTTGPKIERHNGVSDWILVNFNDPLKLGVRPFVTPPLLKGTVLDKKTGLPLRAAVKLTDNKTLDSLASAVSEPDTGNFGMLMPAYGLVSMNVLAKGYLFHGEDILMDTLFSRVSIKQTYELEPIRLGASLILKNIYFDTGKWELLPESFAELERVVAFLKLNPRVVIEVSGHTDNTGNKKQKVELSLRRANAVKAYLIDQGIMELRLKVKGYGMYRPIATNKTSAGRRKNRRVEFEIINI